MVGAPGRGADPGGVNYPTARCTAVPLRSDQLAHSVHLAKQSNPVFFEGFAYTTRTHGASMTRSGVVAKRLYLVTTMCASCGMVQARWNGKVIANINLHRATTAHKQVVPLHAWPTARAGTLVLTVTSASGKPAVIEGLVVYDA
jgi:hypothetical protein